MGVYKQIEMYILCHQACLLAAAISSHWQLLRFLTCDISNVLSKSYRKMKTCYRFIGKLKELGLSREEIKWKNKVPQARKQGPDSLRKDGGSSSKYYNSEILASM